MPRPHIEFIQSQQLPWVPARWAWPGAGVECKLLSEDSGDGACSCILRYPPGWRGAGPAAIDAAEELLVLEGELVIDGERYTQDCYAYLPAGYARREVASERGAAVLTFFDKAPAKRTRGGDWDESLLVRRLDTFTLPWEASGIDPAYADVGLRHKVLRHDPATENRTILVTLPPHLHPAGWSGPQRRHDCVEEMFLLAGDFLSNVGLMREGAYFWRPPGIPHGPYGSRAGNLALIRTLGHELVNNWTDYEVAISREPEHRPFLPERLAGLREQPWRAPERF